MAGMETGEYSILDGGEETLALQPLTSEYVGSEKGEMITGSLEHFIPMALVWVLLMNCAGGVVAGKTVD